MRGWIFFMAGAWLALLAFVMLFPREADTFSVDGLLARRRAA